MESLAIIGTGVAGMGCAHLLQNKYDITVFERNNYVGGHTNTICIEEKEETVFLDTGFMVFNFETYPHLCNLFKEIKAPIKKTEMSFSVQHRLSGLEYSGSGVNGLFAQRKNIFNAKYIRMLMQISRFNSISKQVLENPKYADYTLGKYIEEFGFGHDMLWKYLIPMSSAVWSTPMEKMLDFPVITLIRFFKNHGFLGLDTQHQWYTLEKGSQAYREILIQPFRDKIFVNKGVKKVIRKENRVVIEFEKEERREFDKVIFASHADETLGMIDQPSPLEKQLLSAFQYQKNLATVHTDESVMPRNKSVWSSWNYSIEEKNGKQLASTIYWMNKLQGVSKKKNYFVSINAIPESIAKSKIVREINYEHPLFDLPAIKAQEGLRQLNENGVLYFCGSYFKYGFHEDAYASAVELCKKL